MLRQMSYASLLLLVAAAGCKEKEKIVVQKVEVPVDKIVYVDKEPTDGGGAAAPTVVSSGTGTGSGSGTGSGTGTGTSVVVASTDIVFSGSLALSTDSGGASLMLTADTTTDYALNCITFATDPKALRVDVTAGDGGLLVFSGTLTDFAGQAFGCFLLYKNEPKAPVIFGADSSILAGAGNLTAAIQYNDGTKSAAAVIDLESSTSLKNDAVEAAKTARGTADTDVSALSGTYSVQCDAMQPGFTCTSAAGATAVPDKLYLKQFDALGMPKLALWQSKTAHDQCVPSAGTATDATPAFGLKLGSTLFPLNFASQADLNASLDGAFDNLKASSNARQRRLADAIESQAYSRSQWKVDYCAQTPFVDANCKLMPAEIISNSYQDYSTGKTVTYSYVNYVDQTAFDAAADYAGAVTKRFVACNNFWSQDKDICPSGTLTDDKGQGNYAAFYATIGDAEKRLRLVCKDPAQIGYIRYQDNAMADNKTAAEAAASTANGCAVIAAPGSFFNNKYEAMRGAVRSAFAEITATAVNFGGGLCKQYIVPSTFKFTDCASADMQTAINQLNYVYWDTTKPTWINAQMEQTAQAAGFSYESYYAKDRAKEELCRWKGWSLPANNFALDATTSRFTANVGSIYSYLGEHLCPAAYAVYKAGNQTDSATYDLNCAPEFNALTASEQVEAAMRARIGSWDPLRYVACSSADPTVAAEFQTGMDNTCLPQARIAYMCDNSGNCTSNLRCDGTKGGKCLDEFGTFIGRIKSRIGVMDLKAKTDGAFEASNSVSDKWVAYDFTDNKMKACTLTNDTVLNANLAATGTSFSSFYKERVKQVCANVTDDDQGGAKGGLAGGTAGMPGGQGGNSQQGTQTVPDTDLLKKLLFTKCANETCT